MRSISSSPCARETKSASNCDGRDVDPAGEEVAEERGVGLGVARLGLLQVPHGPRSAEERRHRPDPLDGRALAGRLAQAGLEPRAAPFELLVDRWVAQAPQHRDAGGRRERVPRERSRLVDVALRGEELHQVAAPAEGADRQPAADDLPEDRQVGPDAEALLRAPARDAEAGDDLVEDEQARRPRRRACAGPRGSPAPAGRRPCSRRPARRARPRPPRSRARRPPGRCRGRRRCRPSRRPGRRASRGSRRSRAPSPPARAARRRGRGSSPRT